MLTCDRKPPAELAAALGDLDRDLNGQHLVTLGRSRSNAVFVSLCVDMAEHRRRQRLGLGGVERSALLDALAELPSGYEVASGDLDSRVARELATAPTGVVESRAGMLRRQLERPVRVIGVGACASTWAAGLAALRATVGLGPRLIVLPNSAVGDPTVRLEAEHFGIGLVTPDQVVLPPRPFAQIRFTTTEWRLKEQLYSKWLRQFEHDWLRPHEEPSTHPGA